MNAQIVLFGICLGFLISCGGSGGSSPQSAPNDDNDDEVPQAEPTFNETGEIGDEFTADQVAFYRNHDGKLFLSEREYVLHGQPILRQATTTPYRTTHLAIQGEYVTGYGVSHIPEDVDADPIAFYGISGNPTMSAQSGIFVYTGAYTYGDASAEFIPFNINEINANVNFDSGEITGETTNPASEVDEVYFSGTINGNTVELSITDELGTHAAEGLIFGPNGEEIAAGWANEYQAGLLYLEQ